VENLLFQKKEIKLKMEEWKEKEKLKEKEIQEIDNLETQKKIDYIKMSEDGVISLPKEETLEMVRCAFHFYLISR